MPSGCSQVVMFVSVFFIIISTASLVLNTVPCLPLIGCRPAPNVSAGNSTSAAQLDHEHRVFEILEAVCVGRSGHRTTGPLEL